jgi:hypothetical protein
MISLRPTIYKKGVLLGQSYDMEQELSGSIGRLDLRVNLSKSVALIIEFKYCRLKIALSTKDQERLNSALADLARRQLSSETINESLTKASSFLLTDEEKDNIYSRKAFMSGTVSEKTIIMAEKVLKLLPKDVTNQYLAKTARKYLSSKEIAGVSRAILPRPRKPSEDRIDKGLSMAEKRALKAIDQKDYA